MRFSVISRRYAFCGHGCGNDSFSMALTAGMCSTRMGSTTNAVATFTVRRSVPLRLLLTDDLGADIERVERARIARIAAFSEARAKLGDIPGAARAGRLRRESRERMLLESLASLRRQLTDDNRRHTQTFYE